MIKGADKIILTENEKKMKKRNKKKRKC